MRAAGRPTVWVSNRWGSEGFFFFMFIVCFLSSRRRPHVWRKRYRASTKIHLSYTLASSPWMSSIKFLRVLLQHGRRKCIFFPGATRTDLSKNLHTHHKIAFCWSLKYYSSIFFSITKCKHKQTLCTK